MAAIAQWLVYRSVEPKKWVRIPLAAQIKVIKMKDRRDAKYLIERQKLLKEYETLPTRDKVTISIKNLDKLRKRLEEEWYAYVSLVL